MIFGTFLKIFFFFRKIRQFIKYQWGKNYWKKYLDLFLLEIIAHKVFTNQDGELKAWNVGGSKKPLDSHAHVKQATPKSMRPRLYQWNLQRHNLNKIMSILLCFVFLIFFLLNNEYFTYCLGQQVLGWCQKW